MTRGIGGEFIFRPASAADFWGFLYDWNTAMVWQADYRPIAEDRRLLAGDFILRRYLANMRDEARGRSLFIGLGIGVAEITFPASEGSPTHDTWWSWVVESGIEMSPSDKWVALCKVQWRHYSHNNWNYSGYSVSVGLGIPVPW
jgi:hypothetical protein